MILLVGAGPMAQDYATVLNALGKAFTVIGRGEASAQAFYDATGKAVVTGGLDDYLSKPHEAYDFAIVSVGVEALATTTSALLDDGVKAILVEKPAGLDLAQIERLCLQAKTCQAKVYVAYNRRFYSSVYRAQEIIEQDGGVSSFNFELTEWGHVIANIDKAEGVKESWFLANTSHVSDLAFFLGGYPQQISSFCSDKTSWHSRSANFAGAGRSENGALFCYNGNWNAPGRWSVEVLTRNHRLILRPMEQLQVQEIGSVVQTQVEIDDQFDRTFKPGLYRQIEAFLADDTTRLCDIELQLKMTQIYCQMAGY